MKNVFIYLLVFFIMIAFIINIQIDASDNFQEVYKSLTLKINTLIEY